MSLKGNPVRALLEERALGASSRAAYVEGATGDSLTWGSVAAGLKGWDRLAAVDFQARVGLLARDPLEMVCGYLGALGAGVLVAPLDPAASPPELIDQACRLGLTAIVTDAAASSAARGVAWPSLVLGPDGPEGAPELGAPEPGAPEPGAAMLLRSSGTTGEPKIIPLTADQLLATAAGVASTHRLEGGDTGYSPLPLFHINGLVVGVLSTLVTGGRLVVDRRFSAGRFWQVVADHEVTWLNLVPAIISILSEREAPPATVAASVAFARSASAPLPAAVRDHFERCCGIGVLETYGMTEAASQIAANPRETSLRRPGSVGLPVDVDLRIVDRRLRPLPAGEVGQVQIRGERVVSNYWSAPAPAGSPGQPRPAVGVDGWLETGDLGWVDADGYVFLVGRLDDVINRGGEKVFPREVEEVLVADPAVASAAVVGRPHRIVGEEPIAFVLPVAGADVAGLERRLAELCACQLTRFKRPAQIIVAESLPSGPTGKIRHAELRRTLASAAAPASEPRSEAFVPGSTG